MKTQSLHLVFMLCLLASLCNAQLPSYLPTNGLVAWYPFNGNANDESGNGNDGQVSGATLTQDRFSNSNQAYSFDGEDDIISIPFATSQLSGNYTISAWINLVSYSSSYPQILWSDNNNGANNEYSFRLQLDNNLQGAYYFMEIEPGDAGIVLSSGPNQIAPGNNYHLLVNKSSNSTDFYINNELMASTAPINPTILSDSIFVGHFGSYFGFQGTIDDIAIYNRALSAAEVTALYTASATGTGGGTLSTSTAPPGIPYQAEVRSESGEVLANANVNVRFTLHELTANGSVSFQETHALTTNELGLFAATIGAGTAVQGTFASINWAQTTKFLQVEVDSGSGWITMGNQQLMSVPYAMYAANGPAGPAGPQGLRGEAGPAGPQGPQGASAPATNGSFNHYIGERFGGGIVFHVYRDTLGEEHGLIIAEKIFPGPFCDCPLADYQYWSNRITALNATNTYNGEINTSRLMLDPAIENGIIGTVSNLSLNGFPDWYLPSIGELKLIMRDTWTLMQVGNWEDETGITQNLGIERHWIASSSFDPFSGNMRLWGPSSYDSSFGIITLDVEQANINTVGLAVRKF